MSDAQVVTSTPTHTSTPTATATSTASVRPTQSVTPTTTVTATLTQSVATATVTPTNVPTRPAVTWTPTITRTPTRTTIPTQTPIPTTTPTPTVVATQTVTPTAVAAQISDVATSSITRSSATITWTTSAPASSQVTYGTFSPSTNTTAVDPSLVTSHRVVLTGLQPGTIYQFAVLSKTSAGVLATSSNNAVSTAPAGSGPEVADLSVQMATSSTASLGWATSTGTVAQVEYGTSANYGSFTLLNIFTSPAQQLTVSGLHPATTYHWRVKAWDAQGALGASPDATFSTAPAGLATLVGDESVETQRMTLPAGHAVLYQYVATHSGQASVIRLYLDAGSATPVLRVALYSDQDGAPGTILAQGSAPGLVPGWVSISIPPVSLLESKRYWIGVLAPFGGGSLNLRQTLSGGSSMASVQTSLAAFPQPFLPGPAAAQSPLSVYMQQLPPAITLTGIANGNVITGQAQLSALVDDDAPLARLQFYVDGVPVGMPLSAAPWQIAWNTTTLNAGVPHTVSARASDVLGRSGTSGMITVQIDNGPRISNVIVAQGLTATSAQITWSTDIPADGQVEYGPTTAYGLSTPVNAVPDVRHDLELTSLASGAVYHFRVRSRDANGALTVSGDSTFFTAGP